MGAEHSQQRLDADGRAIFEGQEAKVSESVTSATVLRSRPNTATNSSIKRRTMLRQNTGSSTKSVGNKQTNDTASPTSSELSRPPSPPLSVCSDLPYVSYTDRPIGESPKIRNKPHSATQSNSSRTAVMGTIARRSNTNVGAKPKRPQSSFASHSIVIVKPGSKDVEFDIDPDLTRLRNIPQFLPVLRESITSATYTRDREISERLHSNHLLQICSRMQTHLNICATHIANEQNHLTERTKVVSNSITTLFASFVDMQKTYASYAEQFAKIRSISQQLSRCNAVLQDNIASLETINNFLEVEDRLEPFAWHTENKTQLAIRGEAEGAIGGGSGRLTRF